MELRLGLLRDRAEETAAAELDAVQVVLCLSSTYPAIDETIVGNLDTPVDDGSRKRQRQRRCIEHSPEIDFGGAKLGAVNGGPFRLISASTPVREIPSYIYAGECSECVKDPGGRERQRAWNALACDSRSVILQCTNWTLWPWEESSAAISVSSWTPAIVDHDH
ncbi:uncharacterized protein BDW70DRAFT_161683 [Aspergillus foveolatus]|uniref:uncharacterized protein n=1 Tax=Aspergillus foveolatus TaxID=210207 RepID=UPI003CCD43A6